MMHRKFIVLLIFLFAVSLFAQRNYSFGWNDEIISVGDQTRYFKIYIPRALGSGVPMVILFHHENSGMDSIFDEVYGGFAEWPALAESEKFILLIPNGTNTETGNTFGENQDWNDCRKDSEVKKKLGSSDDIAFVDKLIKWSEQNLDIDKNRIYAAGISDGGLMVYRTAIELGDKIAGAAVFLANLPADSECAEPIRPLPIFIMNSTDDPLVPYYGGQLLGDRGSLMSSEQTLNYWIGLNYLNTQKRTNKYLDDINPDDNSRIIQNKFDRPLDNPSVVFYVVTNAGHTIPSIKHAVPSSFSNIYGSQNRDIESVKEAWKFLRDFTID